MPSQPVRLYQDDERERGGGGRERERDRQTDRQTETDRGEGSVSPELTTELNLWWMIFEQRLFCGCMQSPMREYQSTTALCTAQCPSSTAALSAGGIFCVLSFSLPAARGFLRTPRDPSAPPVSRHIIMSDASAPQV